MIEKGKKGRRTNKDIDRYYPPAEVLELIERGIPWNYRRNSERYLIRDKGLMSFVYMMSCRINEALQVEKSQFNFETDPEFIVVRDFKISKRTLRIIAREGIPRISFGLPIVGPLKRFTEIFLEWFYLSEKNRENPLVFPGIGRYRAWQIIKHHTGKWCHWFRAQRLSYLVNEIRSDTATAKMLGIKNPRTISHYYQGEWKDHKDALKGV